MAIRLPTLKIVSPQAVAEPPMFPDSEQESRGPSLQQIVAIIWAHRKISLLLIVVLSLLFAGLIKLLPKSYDANATIMVNFDSGDSLGGAAFPAGYMDSYIATQIEIMQSSPVIAAVVKELGIPTLGEFSAGYKGQGSIEDWVRIQLLKNLTIIHTVGTQLIYVNATSKSPADAARIANAMVKVYLAQLDDRLNKPAIERADRYSQQLADLKAKVNMAQSKVTEFRQRHQLTNMNANNDDAEVATLNDMETRYQEALEAERALEVGKSSQQDLALGATQSPVIIALRGQLAGMQTKMAELKTTFGAKHPKVVELQSQMDAIQAQINNETGALSRTLNMQLAAARERVSMMRAALEAQRNRALSLRHDQDEGGKLLLELDSAQAVYKRALDGYDKIMATAGGEASNVRLMTSAEAPLNPTKPKKMKLLMMAIFAAIGFGLAAPFVYDFLLHRQIRCKDDIERDLAIPVLAEFYMLSHDGEES